MTTDPTTAVERVEPPCVHSGIRKGCASCYEHWAHALQADLAIVSEAYEASSKQAGAALLENTKLREALERLWEVEQLGEYLEGPDSDYGEPALSTRKAVQKLAAALERK